MAEERVSVLPVCKRVFGAFANPDDYCADCHHRVWEHKAELVTTAAKETVNHPAHYGGDTVYETIKVLKAWLPREQYIGFLRGNAIKYQSRIGKKGDPVDAADDVAKAKWYGDELAKELNE